FFAQAAALAGELLLLCGEPPLLIGEPSPLLRELLLGSPQPFARLLRLRLLLLPALPGFAQDGLGSLDDEIRETVLLGDRQSSAVPRKARVQAIVRTSALLVELHGRTHRVASLGSEFLDRREVSRDDRPASPREVLLEPGDSERAPFFGVGRAADLVDQS